MESLISRSFVSLVIVQIASLFGSAVLRFALPLYVLDLTESATLIGRGDGGRLASYIVLTPIGGVAADRVNKKRIMAALDAIMAATCVVYLGSRGRSISSGFRSSRLSCCTRRRACTSPRFRRLCRFLVPRQGVVRATAVVSQISALSGLVGPVVGGLVFGLFGIGPVVAVSGVAFALSAVLIVTTVRIPHDAVERSDAGVIRTVSVTSRKASRSCVVIVRSSSRPSSLRPASTLR